jgi:hypothetical protein
LECWVLRHTGHGWCHILATADVSSTLSLLSRSPVRKDLARRIRRIGHDSRVILEQRGQADTLATLEELVRRVAEQLRAQGYRVELTG